MATLRAACWGHYGAHLPSRSPMAKSLTTFCRTRPQVHYGTNRHRHHTSTTTITHHASKLERQDRTRMAICNLVRRRDDNSTNSKPRAVTWPPCLEGKFGLACNTEDGTETIMCMRVVCVGCCVGSAKRTQRWLAPSAVRSWRSRYRVWPSARRAAIALPHAVPSPLPMLVSGRQLGTTRL